VTGTPRRYTKEKVKMKKGRRKILKFPIFFVSFVNFVGFVRTLLKKGYSLGLGSMSSLMLGGTLP
jgi:hypothetical protein